MKGLYNKYIVSKTNGKPVDPEARYLVLRLDSGEYIDACWKGAMAFANAVEPLNADLAFDIHMEYLERVSKDIKGEVNHD